MAEVGAFLQTSPRFCRPDIWPSMVVSTILPSAGSIASGRREDQLQVALPGSTGRGGAVSVWMAHESAFFCAPQCSELLVGEAGRTGHISSMCSVLVPRDPRISVMDVLGGFSWLMG